MYYVISRKDYRNDLFLKAGLSNVKNKSGIFFYFFINEAYLYGTVEEFVMYSIH